MTTSNLKEDSVWFVLHLAARVGLGEATNPIRGVQREKQSSGEDNGTILWVGRMLQLESRLSVGQCPEQNLQGPFIRSPTRQATDEGPFFPTEQSISNLKEDGGIIKCNHF